MTMDCRVGEMDAAEKNVHCLVAKIMWTKMKNSNPEHKVRGNIVCLT